MRTTLTLDDDVAARIEALRGTQGLKELINQALRLGLDRLESPPTRKPYRIKPVDMGPALVDVTCIGEIIERDDEERYRDLLRQRE